MVSFIAALFSVNVCVATLEQRPIEGGSGPAERYYKIEGETDITPIDALPADCIVVSATNGGREGIVGEDNDGRQ